VQLLKEIQPHVTHFSEQIRLNANHLDEVTVAGKIVNIMPPVLETQENSLMSSYVFEIDDQVGSLHVYVSPLMYHHFINILHAGNVVAFEGFVNVVSREMNGELKKDYSVVAYDAKLVKQAEE
jgi:hypothetical protein